MQSNVVLASTECKKNTKMVTHTSIVYSDKLCSHVANRHFATNSEILLFENAY